MQTLGHGALFGELQQSGSVGAGDAGGVDQLSFVEAEGLARSRCATKGSIGARPVEPGLVFDGAGGGQADAAYHLVTKRDRRQQRPAVQLVSLGDGYGRWKDRRARVGRPLEERVIRLEASDHRAVGQGSEGWGGCPGAAEHGAGPFGGRLLCEVGHHAGPWRGRSQQAAGHVVEDVDPDRFHDVGWQVCVGGLDYELRETPCLVHGHSSGCTPVAEL